MAFIFGYGALISSKEMRAFTKKETFGSGLIYICKLDGYERRWNIASTNSQEHEKYYVYAENKKAVSRNITLLNLEPSPHKFVYGVLYKVSDESFNKYKNDTDEYQELEITNNIDVDLPKGEKAYAYVGTKKAKSLYNNSLKKENLAISESNYLMVRNLVKNLGDSSNKNYFADTDYFGFTKNMEEQTLDEKVFFVKMDRINNTDSKVKSQRNSLLQKIYFVIIMALTIAGVYGYMYISPN